MLFTTRLFRKEEGEALDFYSLLLSSPFASIAKDSETLEGYFYSKRFPSMANP